MNKNLKIFLRIILIFLIITNCVVIFKFSSEQSEQSDKSSGRIVDTIVENHPKMKKLSQKEKEIKKQEIVFPVRKMAHFSVYTCLGILLYLFMKTFEISNRKKVLISIVLAFLYACSDEIHQLFVGGRSGEFRDVLIDSCGAGFGIFVVWIICEIYKKIKKQNKAIKM